MRLGHARRAAVTLAAGSAVLTAASGGIIAAAADGAAAAGGTSPGLRESCETLKPPTASPSPSPAKTSARPSPSPTATATAGTPTPTATATTPTPTPTPTPTTVTPTPTPTPTPTTAMPTPTPTGADAADTEAGGPIVPTAAIVTEDTSSAAAPAALCVGILPLQQSRERGQAAQWTVAAWAKGGTIPDATIKLQVTPSGGGTAAFTVGCAAGNGASFCHLGAVDAASAQRQFRAQVTVSLTAATVTSVTLTVTGDATGLRTAPRASASIPVLAPSVPVDAMPSLRAGDIPGVTAPAPTLSPGGNAAGLFPTLNPSPAVPGPGSAGPVGARRVADSRTALGTSNQIGAEVAGLAALALAFILAIARVSIRRPVPAATGTSAPPEPAAKALEQPGKPEETPEAPSA